MVSCRLGILHGRVADILFGNCAHSVYCKVLGRSGRPDCFCKHPLVVVTVVYFTLKKFPLISVMWF